MSRPRATINEMMGSAAMSGHKELGLDDLENLLGERMPKMEYSPRGRHRLITALRNRFGENFRTLKGIDRILSEFDREAAFNVKMMEMRQIRGK